MINIVRAFWGLAVVPLAVLNLAFAQVTQIRENFDRDPRWDCVNNITPVTPVEVTQDFGYSPTAHAGGERPGEAGGRFWRADAPAYYGKTIGPLTLEDHLTASGRFRVTREVGNGAVLVGWFNSRTLGWRPMSWAGFWLDEGRQARVEYNTQTNQSGGFRFPAEATLTVGNSYAWSYAYDPDGAGGIGTAALTISGSEFDQPRTYSGALLPGHKAAGARFDRFGFLNLQRPGDWLEVFFDDLVINGEAVGFDADPQWDGQGNRVNYFDSNLSGAQNYGYQDSQFAGGTVPGELGGRIWRNDPDRIGAIGYYADDVGTLTLRQSLHAAGKLILTEAAPDSAVFLGWFDPAQLGWPPVNFVGALIEGPSDIGHFFRPYYATSEAGALGEAKPAPVLYPDGRVHEWSIDFEPEANSGAGAVSVRIDGQRRDLPLPTAHRTLGATLHRFGLMTMNFSGGDHLTIYLDDIEYTSSRTNQANAGVASKLAQAYQ